jgi:hypothetical protein
MACQCQLHDDFRVPFFDLPGSGVARIIVGLAVPDADDLSTILTYMVLGRAHVSALAQRRGPLGDSWLSSSALFDRSIRRIVSFSARMGF